MSFYLYRIGKALQARRHWWWLVLVLPLLYLIYAAFDAAQTHLTQQFSYSGGDLPVAASNSPTGSFRLQQIIDHPDLVFLDEFALMQLDRKLSTLDELVGAGSQTALPNLIAETMTLSRHGDSELVLGYQGSNQLLGNLLLSFYTDRLLRKASEGMLRERASDEQADHYLRLSGEIQAGESRRWWRADRLPMALLLLALSGSGLFLLIVTLELMDPSFKSERQMARYLELPVLGSMPDINRLARQIHPAGRVMRDSTSLSRPGS